MGDALTRFWHPVQQPQKYTTFLHNSINYKHAPLPVQNHYTQLCNQTDNADRFFVVFQAPLVLSIQNQFLWENTNFGKSCVKFDSN